MLSIYFFLYVLSWLVVHHQEFRVRNRPNMITLPVTSSSP